MHQRCFPEQNSSLFYYIYSILPAPTSSRLSFHNNAREDRGCMKISQDSFLSGSFFFFLDNQFCVVCMCVHVCVSCLSIVIMTYSKLLCIWEFLETPSPSSLVNLRPELLLLDILMCQENVLKHKQATSPTLIKCRICGWFICTQEKGKDYRGWLWLAYYITLPVRFH